MEHSCYKCSAHVDDGIAFCPQCNAPQIRVTNLETVGISSTEVPPSGLGIGFPAPGIRWSAGLPSAGIAGVIAAVLMTIPLGAFGLGMLAAGILSVVFYRRKSHLDLTSGAGAKLGAVTGLLGFSIFAIFTAIEVQVFHKGGELRGLLIEAVRQAAARSPDPQSQKAIEYLQSPAGLVVVMGLGMAVMLVAFLVFSSLGGALGAFLFRHRKREI